MQVHEFQQMMRRVYFRRDRERGVTRTHEWLADEVRELGEALNENRKEGVEEEFADVFAWLASLANITGVNLEKAALRKYHRKCPKCGHSPCQCIF